MSRERRPQKLPDSIPRLFTVAECAAALHCSPSTVYVLCETAALPSIKIGAEGGGIRVIDTDLQAFIESRRTRPPKMEARPTSGLRRLRL